MGKGPGYRHTAVLHLEPKRAASTIGGIVLMLITATVVVGALTFPDTWPRPNPPQISDQTLHIAAAVAGFLTLVALLASIHNGRRWHTARAIVKISNDPSWSEFLPKPALVTPRVAATSIPPLQVNVVKPRRYGRKEPKLRPVTLERNVAGYQPLHILYLRLFENQPRMRTFIEGAWREFGYVYMLRSATSVTPGELRRAKRHGGFRSMFIDSDERMWAFCASCGQQPLRKGRYTFTDIGPTTIRVRDKYGSYPARPMLCHGTYWQAAVTSLIARVDLVALDLSGFTEANAGTRFELQRVIDTFPIERVVFLADRFTNERFIEQQLREAWSNMAAESPNASPQPRLAVLAETDYFAQRQQAGQAGQAGQTYVRLESRRTQTRKVALDAQRRL